MGRPILVIVNNTRLEVFTSYDAAGDFIKMYSESDNESAHIEMRSYSVFDGEGWDEWGSGQATYVVSYEDCDVGTIHLLYPTRERLMNKLKNMYCDEYTVRCVYAG